MSIFDENRRKITDLMCELGSFDKNHLIKTFTKRQEGKTILIDGSQTIADYLEELAEWGYIYNTGFGIYSVLENTKIKIPTKVPRKGFYYHYKHCAKKPVNDHAYEVLGVGINTEDECRPNDVNMVVYRSLYRSSTFVAGKFFNLSPLEMWIGDIVKRGKTIPRFKRITDRNIISRLESIRAEMY
jgi:hypothetical protein